ncbi:MAG: mannose-1-phosphate guanylyltransferase [Gemmatimonadales bacterium]
MRWAVVLAGGAGTRFWPVSTARRPKQLLNLAGNDSLLAQTIARIVPLIPADRILIVTSRALKGAVSRAVPAVPEDNVLAEPRAASTAPALAWATAHASRQDAAATVLSLHADWAVGDAAGFRAAAAAALELAEKEDVLVTVGAKPTRPETGYGYIVPGKPLGKRARAIAKFVEKPTLARVKALLKQRALWNTGMFAWTASRFRAEVAAHTTEIAGAMALFDAGDADRAYAALKPVSIDVGVFERTRRGAVISAAFGWDDIGSWAALRRVRPKDKNGNVTVGGAEVVDSRNCVAWSEDGTVVMYGMSDAVVVKTRGITLVTSAARAPELKRLLDRLPPDLAGERGA